MNQAARNDRERELALIALGASLVDEDYRTLFLESCPIGEIGASDMREVFAALEKKDGVAVWQWFASYGIEQGESVLGQVRRHLASIGKCRALKQEADRLSMAYAAGNYLQCCEHAGNVSEINKR